MTGHPDKTQLVVERLRQAAGTGSKPIHSDVEASDYDWSLPHAFTGREMQKLKELLHRSGRTVSRRLGEQLQADIDVAAGEPEQLYRHTFRNEQRQGAEYVYPFNRSGGGLCGMLIVSRPQAVTLVTKMLGSSSEQSAKDRELSSLETDLLGYLLGSVMDAVSDILAELDGAKLEADGKLLEDERPVPESVTELCRVSFDAQDDGDLSVTLVLDSTIVAEVIRPESAAKRSAEEIAAEMREYVGQAPVHVTARLGTVQVPMRAIADLAEGDVLVLPNLVDTPLTVRANGKAVLQGHPVASHGRCALKISARLDET
ncbi:MAG: FliM/FliN family flagellar motor switch protein [Phycisphaerae bacterium]